MKKKIIKYMLITLYIYLGLMGILYMKQRSFMYFPGGQREDIATITENTPQTIPVTSDEGINFEAWYWPAEKGFPTIAFFHGNGQAYPYWVGKLMNYHAQGFGIYFTDYRGYGGVAGELSEENVFKDTRAHLTTLMESKDITAEDLIYYGESLGTGVAVQMATEFPPKAIVLESPYSATSEVAKSRYWMFPVDLLMKDQYRSIDKISELTMPKFFIHGGKDMVIPIRFGKALYDAAPEPKQWKEVENSGHNNLYDHGAQLHISQFLSTLHTQKR